MKEEEIALKLTEMINDNTNANTQNYLTEVGVISTYKRVLNSLRGL